MTKDTKLCGRTASFLKLKLLASGSLTAATILLALAPQTALAQAASPSGHAVNADPTFTSGTGSFMPDTTVDTVFVDSGQVILDWTLFDESGTDTINFLPSDNSLVFDTINGGDYTVLNRIVPTNQTRGISIDGNVSSQSSGITAGNIWFYSPGGIIAGAGSNFNVGSLLLTTNAIDTTGGLFGVDGEIRFNGPTGSTSGITIASGAQINALEDNSYVAMVAPRIVQGGTVTVNGSVGYVAAEQADITINNGLFDINVTVGSESGSGIEHTGTTSGPPRIVPVGSPEADNHTIYMVAVPKNQAMTMLLSGSVGYMPASAAIENSVDGTIILSAGGSIASNGFNNTIDETVDPTRNASINISDANIISDVEAFANNDIILEATNSAAITGSRASSSSIQMDLTAGNAIRMEASTGGTIDIDGGATLNAINGAQIVVGESSSINITEELTVNAFSETQGGIIDILISGSGSRMSGSGELIVGNELNVNAGIIGLSGSDASLEQGIDTFGGTINLDITAGGLLDINANGVNQVSMFDVSAAPIMGTVTAGEATGGTINVNIDGAGSTLTNGGASDLVFAAEGMSGNNFFGSSTGGTNSGGTINFDVTGGLINTYSLFALTGATATENGRFNGQPNLGESENGANAGNITANFTDATLNITNNLAFQNSASARTQYDGNGNESDGIATAGVLNVTFDNSDLNGGSLYFEKDIVGNGSAGDLSLNIVNGSNLSLTSVMQLYAEARANSEGTTTNSGNINLLVDNASLDAPFYFLGTGRTTWAAADASTDGTTGSINVLVQNGGSMTGGNLFVDAGARTFTQGGTATAGDIAINIDGGTLAISEGSFSGPSVSLTASGSGYGNIDDGLASERGLGIGGNITFTMDNGGTFLADSFSSDTSGQIEDFSEGPILIRGQGGNGVGGLTTFNLNSGNFTVGEMSVSSNGLGSFGGNSDPMGFSMEPGVVGDGGDGQGGDIVFNIGGADVAANSMLFSANGFGGDGGYANFLDAMAAGNAGNGSGGNITINATTGSLTVSGNLTVHSNGTGGRGGDGVSVNSGNGGDALGGNAVINIENAATLSAPLVSIAAVATGGRAGDALSDIQAAQPAQRAGDGGNAIGGSAIFSNFGTSSSLSSVEVLAMGFGGDAGNDPDAPVRETDPFSPPLIPAGYVGQDAGNGGSGTGGEARITLGQDDNGNASYQVNANGLGAKGGGGNSGGNAGNGTGGTAVLGITNASISLGDQMITATGTGGDGGIANAILGDGGNGGDGFGGIARLDASGAGAELIVNSESLPIFSDGFGGSGADGASNSGGDGGIGGNGGSATGGTAEIAVRTGANVTINSEAFTLSSTGYGGQGGRGGDTISNTSGDGGDGGQGTGGTARLLAQGGTITGNDVTIVTLGQGGGAGDPGLIEIVNEGISGVRGDYGSGAGGTAILEVQEGSPGIITLGNVSMIANGFNGIDDLIPTDLGGRIEIIDTSTDPAGLISLASLNAEVLAGAGPASGFFMSGNSGTTNVAGDFTVNVAGDVVFTFDGDGLLYVGGGTDINTPQNLIITHTNRPTGRDSIISVGDFNANIGGSIDAIADSSLRSNASIDFISGGSIGFGSLFADSNVNLLSMDGIITGDRVGGDSGINIETPGIVTIGSLDSSGAVDVTGAQGIELQTLIGSSAFLSASDGDVAVRAFAGLTSGLTAKGLNIFLRSSENLEVVAEATDGNIDIVSTGNLVTYGLTAAGDILFSSTGGSVTINEIPAQAGGDITITAANDANIVTGAYATNDLSITAGNLITLQGLATGTAIDLSSADINIGSSGQLGTFTQTSDVYIESNGVNQAILGGTGTTGVFSLSEEEFGRIRANQSLSIFVQATGADTPDLVIQDLTVRSIDDSSAGQMTEATLGFAGALNIDSGQSTRVDGNLNLTNAVSESSLNMIALDDIQINANGGVIQITDGNNDFGSVGFMSLNARNIYAMTDQAFDDINGLSLSDIDLRLGDSDGIDLDGGLIRAGYAQLFVGENLFIQNTAPDGDFNSRRGFTVGSLFTGSSNSGNNINIVINGVIDGVSGADTIELTNIEGQFDPASTVNGCLIVDPTSCGAPPPTPNPNPTPEIPVIDPVQDIIEEEMDSGENGSSINGPLQNNLIEIKEVEEFINDPLIDAPVTGAGNDDLWSGANGSGDEGDCEDGSAECGQTDPAG